MKRLERLVRRLIDSFPAPDSFVVGDDDYGRKGMVHITWYSKDSTSFVSINACEHIILLDAGFSDGGPCPPTREHTYSHTRLALLLSWMNTPTATNAAKLDNLESLARDGSFHQKYVTDPSITRDIYGGHLPSSIWKKLDRT